jgi:hypothetical protein
MTSMVPYLGGWSIAVSVALGLALASPTDSSVMGEIPTFNAVTLSQQSMTVPAGLPQDRMLALIGFKKAHHAQLQSWVDGLNLHGDTSIAWVRMPVIEDPGTREGRHAVEDKLLRRYPDESERAKLLPAFVDRAQFMRAAGLRNTDTPYAVVLNRQGDVLARVEGKYDPDKAGRLLETLQQGGF